MAMRVRTPLEFIAMYGECVCDTVLPAFKDLEARAEEVAQREWEKLLGQPAPEDGDVDMGAVAEEAQDAGIGWYQTMFALRYSSIVIYAAGLFHLVEQQLKDTCSDGSFRVPQPTDTKLSVVADWYKRHFGIDLRDFRTWAPIEELRLVANSVKHGEGSSAMKLHRQRPELFRYPGFDELLFPEAWSPRVPLGSPLAGEGLYIQEGVFEEYCQAARAFFTELAEYFELHSDEWFPKAG